MQLKVHVLPSRIFFLQINLEMATFPSVAKNVSFPTETLVNLTNPTSGKELNCWNLNFG